MNIPLAVEIFNDILDNPSCWNQSSWHCGSAHCFFGHAQVRSGRQPVDARAFTDGMAALELNEPDALWLSAHNRSLSEIRGFIQSKIDGTDYFADSGYNRAGYDRAGYNRDGYNSAGYNSDGYDRAGYNRAGYNSDGYDRDGHRLERLEYVAAE